MDLERMKSKKSATFRDMYRTMPVEVDYSLYKRILDEMCPESLSVDYKTSKEYDKRIYHLNEHSNGYKYRLYWSKIPRTFPDRYKYQLNFVRQNKRRLAQLIFNKHDYIDINDIQLYKV